jgi:endonuclease YncB( thermonuclease family)
LAIVPVLAAGVWIDAYGLSIPTSDRLVCVTQAGRAVSVSRFNVVDGDTVRVRGETFRLLGFNTPETGDQARCSAERDLAFRATSRLRSLIGGAASAELIPMQCACPPGTHGTSACNYGRSCAILQADGRDVGSILIAEGLARPYSCGPTSCPRRHQWC